MGGKHLNMKINKLKRLLEIILPFTLITSFNKEAKLPAWAKPIMSIYTKKRIWVFCKKIINRYD